MEAILVRADLWDLVTGDETLEGDETDEKKLKDFRRRQATCKAEMVLRVDDSLHHRYHNDGQTMESWIGEVRTRARRLESVEVQISDEDIIVVLTAGLPSSFTPVIISFDALEPEKLTLDFVITRLLNEEARQTTHSTVKKEEDETALRAERVNKIGNNVQCFYCLEMGHYSTACPTKLKENKAREDAGRRKLKELLAAFTLDSDEESENYAM